MNDINPKLPHYPLDLEPPEGFGIPASLAALLVGIYQTSDAGEAATLAARGDWIICGVVWQEHPETWVLGMLKPKLTEEGKTGACEAPVADQIASEINRRTKLFYERAIHDSASTAQD